MGDGGSHPRPPSCRCGQRLSRAPRVLPRALRVKKGLNRTPRPASLPVPRGHHLTRFPPPPPWWAILPPGCPAAGGRWHPVGVSDLGPTAGWRAEPVLPRGLTLFCGGAAKWFFRLQAPGTKAALKAETLRAQRAGRRPHHCGSIWPAAGRSLSLWSPGLPRLRAPGRWATAHMRGRDSAPRKRSIWLGTEGGVCLRNWTEPRTPSFTFLGSRVSTRRWGRCPVPSRACFGGGRCEPRERLAARTAGSLAERAGSCGTSTPRAWGGAPRGWRSPSGDAGTGWGGGHLRRGQA